MAPHTGLLALRDAAGVVRRVCVRSDASWFVRLELGPDLEVSIEKVEIPTATDVEVVSGVVEDSVAQALARAPRAGQLTAEYADIFQWDVDLHVDPRPGDEVRVVYETRRLAELPEDLPPFGGAADEPGELVGAGRILAASYLGSLAQAHAFLVDGDDGAQYYDAEGNPLRKSFLRSPLSYRRVSSGFSNARLHPITRRVVPHHGVDYAAPPGTPVVAAADGRVTSAGWQGPLGQAVRIRHPNGYETVYGHLQAFASRVRPGAMVRQNEVIGYVGSTGRATGPHLHYSVLRRGEAIDPERMDNPRREPVPIDLRPKLRLAVERYADWLERQPSSGRHAS
jgi:murein DD-endopeptidase MepM/ murein hydrolase activator NlpD